MEKDKTIPHKDFPADEVAEFAVDLALAVTGYPADGRDGCPLPEILAALSEGKLSESKRQEVLEHLDQCPRCRDEWLLAASDSELPMAEPAPKVGQTFTSGQFFTGLSVGAAVAACLVWFFFVSPLSLVTPAYETAVNKGYGALLKDGPTYASARHVAKGFEVESVTRGGESETAKAFRMGWNSGLMAINTGFAQQDPTPETKALGYVSAVGRWLVLLSVALQTTPGPEPQFWQHQAKVAGFLREESTLVSGTGDSVRLNRGFTALASTLASMGANADKAKRDRLKRQLNGLIHLMRSVNVVGR